MKNTPMLLFPMHSGTSFAKSATQKPSLNNIKNFYSIEYQQILFPSNSLKITGLTKHNMMKLKRTSSRNFMIWYHKRFTTVCIMLILRVENNWMNTFKENCWIFLVNSLQVQLFIRLTLLTGKTLLVELSTLRLQLAVKEVKMLPSQILTQISQQSQHVSTSTCDIHLLLKDIWSLITMKQSTMWKNGRCYWPKELTFRRIVMPNFRNLGKWQMLIFGCWGWLGLANEFWSLSNLFPSGSGDD